MFLTVAAALCVGVAVADDRPIDYKELPQAAKSFVTKYFAKAKVAATTIDAEVMRTEYTVYLEGGTKLEFNKQGAWSKVDCGISAVPSGIVPAAIAGYVAKNHAGASVVKIDVGRTDYELDLSNGLELKFDLKGNFLRMDN